MTNDEKVIKHLEMIQHVIDRMASNSFFIKGISITIFTTSISILYSMMSFEIAILLSIVAFYLCLIDQQFLKIEKEYRALYDQVRHQKDTDFSMNRIKLGFRETMESTLSFFMISFYIFLAVVPYAILLI